MKCPSCGHPDSKVVDSRPTEESSIRRRRECLICHKRFTTYEIIDEVPIFVIKKNKGKEIFDPNKIMSGLRRACYKRPVTETDLSAIVSEIEADINNALKIEISSAELGEMVMDKLKAIDEVSYVRFASVYREFKDVDTFLEELRTLTEVKKPVANGDVAACIQTEAKTEETAGNTENNG